MDLVQTLYFAITENNLDEVKNLLKDVDINSNNIISELGDFSPLHLAIDSGSEDVALYLLDQGVDMEIENTWGMTPLLHAVAYGRTRIVKELLFKGANITQRDKEGNYFLDLNFDGTLNSDQKKMSKTIIETFHYLLSQKNIKPATQHK